LTLVPAVADAASMFETVTRGACESVKTLRNEAELARPLSAVRFFNDVLCDIRCLIFTQEIFKE
jgi:hypothetical protein